MMNWRLFALAGVFGVAGIARAQEGSPAPQTAAPVAEVAKVSEAPKSVPSNTESAAVLTAKPVSAPLQDKVAVPAAENSVVSKEPTTKPAAAVAESKPLEKPTQVTNIGPVPGTMAAAPGAPQTQIKKTKKVAKRTKLGGRMARARKGGSRAPASYGMSAEPGEVAVFSEHTSFETIVKERISAGRDPAAFAPSARVIAVRRELGLTAVEAGLAPQDIVLSAGIDSGLNEGMILSVSRSVPVLDPYKDNQQKQLEIEFATVKIVHAQPNVAVARVEKIFPIKTGLAVGTRAILIGDYVGHFR